MQRTHRDTQNLEATGSLEVGAEPTRNSSEMRGVEPLVSDPFTHVSRDAKRHSLAAQALILTVTGYRKYLSPLKGQPTCRFYPTCSQYALEALQKHGATKGTFLAVRRVLKCQPFHPGGFDPVP